MIQSVSFRVGDVTGFTAERLEAMSVGVEGDLEPERQVIVGPKGEALRPLGKDVVLI